MSNINLENIILDERSKKILGAIVQDYIKTAEPVGSNAIVKQHNISLSSATIRSVMNELERLDLITQPHTSAGRIPTNKGYRYYIDSLMNKPKLSKHEEENIKDIYTKKSIDFSDDFFHLTSKLLSAISDYVGFAITPNLLINKVKRIELVSITNKKVLIVLVTNTNTVKNNFLDIDYDINSKELHKISNMLTEKLFGLSITDININKIDLKNQKYLELYKNIINSIKSSLSTDTNNNILLDGTANILRHPEFTDRTKIQEILKIFEEKKDLLNFLDKFNTNDTKNSKAFIGEETNIIEMQDCSIVICKYKITDNLSGIIGIIGPTRMTYGKNFSIIEFTSSHLEKRLKNITEI